MGKKSRDKGAGYEREVANELTEILGSVVIRRRLGQARDGGEDLHLPGFTPELKRRKSIAVHQWMEQACAAALRRLARLGVAKPPIVIMRGDGESSLVVMRLEDWAALARETVVQHAELEVGLEVARVERKATVDAPVQPQT